MLNDTKYYLVQLKDSLQLQNLFLRVAQQNFKKLISVHSLSHSSHLWYPPEKKN